MAYKNNKGYKQGNMSAEVSDYSKPAGCYAQNYDQAPLNYVERQNSMQKHEAGKLRGEAHKGRYCK